MVFLHAPRCWRDQGMVRPALRIRPYSNAADGTVLRIPGKRVPRSWPWYPLKPGLVQLDVEMASQLFDEFDD